MHAILLPTKRYARPELPVSKRRHPLAVWDAKLSLFNGSKKKSIVEHVDKLPPKLVTYVSPWENESCYGKSSPSEITSEYAVYCNDSAQSLSIGHSNEDLLTAETFENKSHFYTNDSLENSNTKIDLPNFHFFKEMDSPRQNSEQNTILSELKEKSPPEVKRKSNKSSLNQHSKKHNPLTAGKTVSCCELPTQSLKASSSSDLSTKTLFFNEKGWPVKVMRLTENSPPKPLKPWPSRSLQSTTCNKSPRKVRSIYTRKTPAPVKSSRENKENKECVVVKGRSTSPEKNIETNIKTAESEDSKEVATGHGIESDLKLVLDQLNDTMGKLSSEKSKQADNDTKPPMNKAIVKPTRPKTMDRKPPSSETKEIACSARSNKYDSKEMKAYIQAKRTERKLQMSEETRKKQEMMVLQKKNLEKLREKACQVLKKSSTKTVEENKPRWQGPLEEDQSEHSPAAIFIFDSKIPTARKSKLNLKNNGNLSINPTGDPKQDENLVCDGRKSEEIKKFTITAKSDETVDSVDVGVDSMEKQRRRNGGSGFCKKLRVSRNKLSSEYPKVLSSLEHQQVLRVESEDTGPPSHLPHSPRSAHDWKNYLPCTENDQAHPLNHESRRSTFNIPHPKFFSSHSQPDLNERKRQSSSPRQSTHASCPVKKVCSNENIPSAHESPVDNDTMENALKKIQEEMSLNQKEGKNSEWLQSFLKPDGLNMMNVIQMKSVLFNQKNESSESEKKGRLKQKVIPGQCSLEDETDAPSITSMEDFHVLPEPLRLSDLHLAIPKSTSTEESLLSTVHSSMVTSKAKMRLTDGSDKTSSSITSDVQPLVVPKSVQNLKLRTRRSQSGLSCCGSPRIQPLHTSLDSATSASCDQPAPLSPVLSSSSSKVSLQQHASQEDKLDERQPKPPDLHNEQIEIGQVLSSSALLLQFHLELSRLDAFDQSLAQVIATERLYHTPTHARLYCQSSSQSKFVSGSIAASSARSDVSEAVQARRGSPPTSDGLRVSNLSTVSDSDRSNHVNGFVPDGTSQSPQLTSVSEHLAAQQKQGDRLQSGDSDASSGRVNSQSHRDRLVSEHLPTLVTRSLESLRRSAPSSLHSVEEMSLTLEESTQEEEPVVSEKFVLPVGSMSALLHGSFSPKNLRFLQVLIDEAEFQKKQHEFLYKTQEDSLRANYKVALTELDSGFRGLLGSNTEVVTKENDIRATIEKHYKTTIANIRGTRNHVLSNWNKRIEELIKERDLLMKHINKPNVLKLRSSAEASPKKLIPLRSSSVTSVMESSSSEDSVIIQTFDDKKRQENDKEKIVMFNRKKIEKELLKKVREEMRKVQELEKSERLLKIGRSRRDKSTSPLESVLEASTRDVGCSVRDDNESVSQLATSSLHSVEEARATDIYNSESFESPESSETPRQPRMFNRPGLASKPFVAARLNNKSKVLIKVPLSPRLQLGAKQRCSSGSDESLLLSQNETQSEQSDYEVRISALKEQKRQRYAELNRLQRELKRAQKEQLKATEASLIKQIQVYDSYIDQTKKQLAEVSATNAVRPQIKHPRLSDRFVPRISDVLRQKSAVEDNSKLETPASDIDTNSLKSVSEAASSIETTIQSSGVVPTTEHSSPQTEINNVYNNDGLSAESEVAEALSSFCSEAVNTVDIHNSHASEVYDEIGEVLKSAASDVLRASDSNGESQWVDAVKFFNQLDIPDQTISDKSSYSKINIEEHSSSTKSKTNTYKITTSISQNIPNDHSVEEEIGSGHKSSSPGPITPEENLSQTKTESIEDKSTDELITQITEEEINKPDNIDVGSVVSIISQAPSPVTSKSLNSQDRTDNDVKSTIDNVVSEVQSEHINDLSDPISISEKLNLTEAIPSCSSQSNEATSVSSDIVVSSQHSSEEDGNSLLSQSHSEHNEPSEASQSETVIKVVVSSKNQINAEDKLAVDIETSINLNQTYDIIDESEEIKSAVDHRRVDKITDDILTSLLSECLNQEVVSIKRDQNEGPVENEVHEKSQMSNEVVLNDDRGPEKLEEVLADDFTTTVLNKFLQDATECMLRIKESKKTSPVNFNSRSSVEDTQSNLLDALDVEGYKRRSPRNACEDDFSSPLSKSAEVELNDGHEGDVFWFDEDHHPVSLQAQREAEELRIKQLQIEQEIKQLEKAQENIPSYYYVREIPNKPPPPYTPPGQSKEPAPTKQEDIESLVTTAIESLGAAWLRGDDLSMVQPSEQYSLARVGNQTYKKFLFDLVRQILIETPTSRGSDRDTPPWERTGCRVSQLVIPKLTEQTITGYVLKKVRILFGFEPSAIKESLIIQWSRKKRDRVDELLVRESQQEEQEWTDYTKCEVAVKNTIALSIFDSLIEETTLVLKSVLQKKIRYSLERQLS